MAGELLIDEPADGVLRLTISNPSKRNALDHAILDAIARGRVGAGERDGVALPGAHRRRRDVLLGLRPGRDPRRRLRGRGRAPRRPPVHRARSRRSTLRRARRSRRCRATRSAAAWSWRWPATCASPPTASASGCRRPSSAWCTRTPGCGASSTRSASAAHARAVPARPHDRRAHGAGLGPGQRGRPARRDLEEAALSIGRASWPPTRRSACAATSASARAAARAAAR